MRKMRLQLGFARGLALAAEPPTLPPSVPGMALRLQVIVRTPGPAPEPAPTFCRERCGFLKSSRKKFPKKGTLLGPGG